MTMRNKCGWWLIAATLLILPGCNQSKREETSMAIATQINRPEWRVLEKMRVVFGHQSVGWNILNGVELLNTRNGGNLTIREQRTAPKTHGISHFAIGNNGDPLSKIEDFAAAIDAGAAQNADVALMKLCYIDFNAATDAQQLANSYIANLDSLAKRHPKTNFVAVTAPLMAVQTGPKAWLKGLIGKQPGGYVDNLKRAEFNTLLRKRYLATGRLFDLARAEAESGGKSCQASVNGQIVEALCPELTNDGGHLNERGQELVATAFLNFASSLSTEQVAK
ncbi:hypothetical protein [Candidatus Methylobacter oryzae]|uniref:SGNH/GDSL hydrolase family protein n=1 Tax=Candidatus Methylobacter oryzae TaxID=2497749 RepID=A0ABY3C7L2_9GAMM|nr:hypothetical protein [Candidatus Methylobacter oryzae]TRW92065.1 hypothetical protein EKO24_015475 [Candidatus Methylobacter oryzae]